MMIQNMILHFFIWSREIDICRFGMESSRTGEILIECDSFGGGDWLTGACNGIIRHAPTFDWVQASYCAGSIMTVLVGLG